MAAPSRTPGMPQYQMLITRQLQYLVQNSDIRWEHVPGSIARFNLLLPFCYELLCWQVEFQRIAGVWVPDFVFTDATFNPLLPSSDAEPLGGKILSWKLEDERQLLSLMKSIIRRFTAHQKALIHDAAEGDRRMQREAETIFGSGGPSNMEVLFLHGHPNKAVFVASVVDLELSKLQPFFDRNWATFGEKMPAEAVAKLQRMIYLRAVFQMHSSSPPQISLHMPEHLAALIGSVAMPSWTPRMTFLEFLPLAFSSLQSQCNAAGDQAMLRQDLLEELAKTKLGPSLETDAVAARYAVYQLMHDGVEWRAHVEIPPTFPESMPRLKLETLSTLPASRKYSDYPWSPRWSTKEMAKRISSFLSGEI